MAFICVSPCLQQ